MYHKTRSQTKRKLEKTDVQNKDTNGTIKSCNSEDETKQKKPRTDDSSSESDLEDYLKSAHEIDLRSSFFEIPKAEKQFSEIEKHILGDVNKLSDSESSEDDDGDISNKAAEELQIINFQQMQDHLRKIEEAKKHVQEYEAKKQNLKKKQRKNKRLGDTNTNIADLLSVGEKFSKNDAGVETIYSDSMSESEREDWEEVKESKEKNIIPKESVQITVQMPGVIREKKGVDLVAAMKRRLNRIKKENQVFIHKVSLLCWIAHGNFVNTTINNQKFLGLALSLIPSEQCYPADRTNLNYLEQILNWYRKTVQNLDRRDDCLKYDLEKQLHIDISKKQASNNKILVLIFICILRALGIHCRLVMSLLVLPLRPPSSELCSLSTKKIDENKTKKTEKSEQLNGSKEKGKASNSKTETEKVEQSIVNCKNSPKIKHKKSGKLQKVESQTTKKKIQEQAVINGEDLSTDINKQSRKSQKAESETTKTVANRGDFPKNIKKPSRKSQTTRQVDKRTAVNGEDSIKHIKKQSSKSQIINNNEDSNNGGKNTESPIKNSKPNLSKLRLSLRKKSNVAEKKVSQTDGANDSETDQQPSSSKMKPNLKKLKETQTGNFKRRQVRFASLPDYKEPDSEEEFFTRSPLIRKNQQPKVNLSKLKKRSGSASPQKVDVKNDIIQLIKGRITEEKQKDKMKMVKAKRKLKQESDEDSDYLPEPTRKKAHDSDDDFVTTSKVKVKRRIQVKENCESNEEEQKKKGTDIWIEVFLEAEEKWISVDVVKKQVHCVNEIYKRATQPISYILAWDNKNYIKDISKRYCPNWNTVTRKLRVDAKWWERTLKPFCGPKTARDKEEDEELAKLQLEKPLPTTISEYKNHPLYALKRHLLKFEAIYPPDAVTLGFVRNEPVYSRECVHTLHSREIWLKHAKVVRPGEKPYKIVKARPKYDKLSNSIITDQLLEIFGSWQVDDYIPPTAENGVVPRNAYGNVELFKECMLPKGTAHLQLPGLNKVAKKLNIDCAPAVVGFDFHSGWSHPMFDGFVVCEEHKDTLIAAWEQEQEEAGRRAQEKIEKRVYDNWKRLIKGVLIRERLKAKYDFGAPSTSGNNNEKRKAKPATLVIKKKW